MRLIDTDKLKFPNIAIFDMKLHGATVPMVRLIDLQMLMPTVDAVPLDKLCGMLSKFVGNPPCPCGYDLKGIGCNPDWTRKDCWKNALITWMEENYCPGCGRKILWE